MLNIRDFQLVLFDFDGLLVNTEEVHYQAYQRMCADRGIKFNWSFSRYCQAAHYEATALRDQLYQEFPELQTIEPDWNVLYAEKKKALLDLVSEGAIHLMPGVEKLLNALEAMQIKRCVVTHSPSDLIEMIRKQNPILDSIPTWITREQYSSPKPHPECYILAIKVLANINDRVIGFEDTPRGLTALLGTRAQPVLICKAKYPEIPSFIERGVLHYPSLECITVN